MERKTKVGYPMDKIARQSRIGKYTVLYLEPNPDSKPKRYRKFKIKDKEYEPIPVYDSPNTIAIVATEEQLVGETVEYL